MVEEGAVQEVRPRCRSEWPCAREHESLRWGRTVGHCGRDSQRKVSQAVLCFFLVPN